MRRLLLCLAVIAGCARSSPPPPAAAEGGEKAVAASPARLAAPAERMTAAINRGVAFLVANQQPDGHWGTGLETRGFEVYSMVPGSHDAFRVGTTSLCVMALREAGEKAASAKGLEYLLQHGQARRDDPTLMYNIWAHLYAVQALSVEMRSNPDPRLRPAVEWHIDRLARYETYVGGWNYYDFDAGTQRPSMEPTSFGTAAALVALWEARQSGCTVPQGMIDRALRRLEEMRLPTGTYMYSAEHRYRPRLPANQIRGSIGRTQACNFALWQWNFGRTTPESVLAGLDFFQREHDYIQMGRKRPMPHESWYQTAAYYYYFGHYYTARLLEKLGPAASPEYATWLADEGILKYQEPDGSWWDYAMWDYHKPYGTAYAVMALLRCRNIVAGAPAGPVATR